MYRNFWFVMTPWTIFVAQTSGGKKLTESGLEKEGGVEQGTTKDDSYMTISVTRLFKPPFNGPRITTETKRMHSLNHRGSKRSYRWYSLRSISSERSRLQRIPCILVNERSPVVTMHCALLKSYPSRRISMHSNRPDVTDRRDHNYWQWTQYALT